MENPQSDFIFVIEDDPDLRLLYVECFTHDGYNIVAAENGVEALTKLRSFTLFPRVILLDLIMPVMNGWEFLREFQKDITLNKIPIVICSASSENLPDHIPFVKKPINRKTLLQIAKDYLPGT